MARGTGYCRTHRHIQPRRRRTSIFGVVTGPDEVVGELVRAEALLRTLVPAELPPCALKIRRLKRNSALYHGTRGITISPDTEDIYGALMHEFGHFLDHALTGPGPFYSSELAAEHFHSRNFPSATRGAQTLARWWAVTEASAGVRDLREKLASRTLSKDERRIAKYLAIPSELFARSFCRWAAERTHDGELAAANASEYVRVRWSDRGFAPIAAEFDALFAADGAAIATLNWCAERRQALASSRHGPLVGGFTEMGYAFRSTRSRVR